MPESVRLFIAVELPERVRSALSDVVKRVVASGARHVRPVRAEAVHLTLKFLGDVPAARIEELAAAVRPVAGMHAAFTLKLSGAGVFPSPGRARVLWLGIGGDMEALGDLHRGIEDAAAKLGFERERRPFSPHLTLARLGERASHTDRSRAAEALLSAPPPDGIEIHVRSVAVMRSTLGRGGATYRRLESAPLGAPLP